MNMFSKYVLLFPLILFCYSSWLSAAEPIPIHLIKPLYDIGGPKSDQLSMPSDVAVNNKYTYVVDSGNHRVVVFDKAGGQAFTFGKEGVKEGEFRGPVGIDVGQDGKIFVADRGNHRVQIFDKTGNFLASIVTSNKKHQLIRPIDVAIDDKNQVLYITGNNNHKLMKFSLEGYLLSEWGGEGVNLGSFRYPATLTMLPDGHIAVVDILNTRVQVFTEYGKVSSQIGSWGVLPGHLFRPKGIAVDMQDRVYVSDSYINVVQVFSSTGHFMYVLGDKGKPTRMEAAVGIAVDDNMRLYVAEMAEHKVSVHQISAFQNEE